MSGDSLFIKRNRPVTKTVSYSFNRPAGGGAPYAAGDVFCNSTTVPVPLTFANCARAPGLGGIIQSAILIHSVAQTTKPDFELYLFDTTLTSQNDDAPWTPSDGVLKTCIGKISFPPGLFDECSAGGNGIIDTESIGKPFQCAPTDTNLYGILVVRNAYSCDGAEEVTIRLHIIQD